EHPADEDPAQRDGPADDKGHRIHAPHRPSVSIATAHRTLSPNPAAARSRGPGFPERKTAGIGAGFFRWGGKSKSSQAIAWFFGRPSLGRGAWAAQRERVEPARAARSASMSAAPSPTSRWSAATGGRPSPRCSARTETRSRRRCASPAAGPSATTGCVSPRKGVSTAKRAKRNLHCKSGNEVKPSGMAHRWSGPHPCYEIRRRCVIVPALIVIGGRYPMDHPRAAAGAVLLAALTAVPLAGIPAAAAAGAPPAAEADDIQVRVGAAGDEARAHGSVD